MIELGSDRDLSSALLDVAVLALWAIPLGMAFAYIRKSAAVRQIKPEFALRSSEAAEWDRAVAQYGRVLRRIEEIDARRTARNFVHRLFLGAHGEFAAEDAALVDDLNAHAAHLHAVVVRLNRQPLERLKAWMHSLSFRFALGYAVAAYLVGLTLLIGSAEFSDRWVGMPADSWVPLLWWCPLGPVVCANALSIAFAGLAAPIAYLLRRLVLRREYHFELRVLKDLARTDPCRLNEQEQVGARRPLDDEPQTSSVEPEEHRDCFEILGLSPSASMDELRAAYKRLSNNIIPIGFMAWRRRSPGLPRPRPEDSTPPISRH